MRLPRLLAAASAKARRTLLASYPRDRLLVRVAVRLENLAFAVLRKRFRTYAHSPEELERAVAREGLTRTRLARSFAWETAQFDPAPSS